MYRKDFEETLIGTPQGGIVSPLLANIYLHELDRYMESKYLNLNRDQRSWRRKKGKGDFLYVRYADDFVVLCNGTKAEAQAIKEELKESLSTKGLTLSEEKTKITHVSEGFTFLGYQIIREIGEMGKKVPKVCIPNSAIKRFRHKVREITSPSTNSDSVRAKIMALNYFTRGWCQYYTCTNSPSKVFHKLEYELFWGLAHWLGRKYKVDMPIILARFNSAQG